MTAKYEKQLTAKCEKYESDKTHQRKTSQRTNVVASTESKVKAAEGSTEARRKDDIGCTEEWDNEKVPALMQEEKY